jgi:hypothetical protein
MSVKQSILGALLAGSLAVPGCCAQKDRSAACGQAAMSRSPTTQKTSAQLPDNRRNADGFLKPEYWPRSVDQAVDLLLAELSTESKQKLRSTPRDELIMYHHGFGTGIRNDFGLWANNDELLRDCGLRDQGIRRTMKEHPDAILIGSDPVKYGKEHPSSRPVEMIVIHPDGASQVIIEALWDRLQQRGGVEAAIPSSDETPG